MNPKQVKTMSRKERFPKFMWYEIEFVFSNVCLACGYQPLESILENRQEKSVREYQRRSNRSIKERSFPFSLNIHFRTAI